jgi:hypothetical protein
VPCCLLDILHTLSYTLPTRNNISTCVINVTFTAHFGAIFFLFPRLFRADCLKVVTSAVSIRFISVAQCLYLSAVFHRRRYSFISKKVLRRVPDSIPGQVIWGL